MTVVIIKVHIPSEKNAELLALTLLGSDLTLESRSFQLEEDLPYLENYYRGAPLDSKSESRDKRALMIDRIIESLNSNEN
jgi:hypothetical protein